MRYTLTVDVTSHKEKEALMEALRKQRKEGTIRSKRCLITESERGIIVTEYSKVL